ncbi:hypothetical protein [Flavobacterium sp.]|uniref:hypothetical protein n=1 Tax=Flavobacterium sp. TaxID=239 RepID=UPI00260B5A8B|nr:hypothetical protein [Flavobacterium sp.]
MFRKYCILLGIIMAIALLVIASLYYPGGSQADPNSVGYDWSDNYISNLFGEKAVNGKDNSGRYWAVAGMLFLSLSFALFFIEFSKKIPISGAAKVIKYCGAGGMVFTFLIATPLHDIMITLSSTLFLLGMFYISVFVWKSKLLIFKILCVVCLLGFYFTLYIYGAGAYRALLPMMQKVTFALVIVLILGLEYFTGKQDFEHLKANK